MSKTVKIKKSKAAKKSIPQQEKSRRYWEGVGRRKTSWARVRVYEKGMGEITINKKDVKNYFPLFEDRQKVFSPFEKLGLGNAFDATVIVKGGGIHSQAEAVRHGIARAILLFNEKEYRQRLRALGYLTRDPRMRERKKPGLKRARKAPQWQKR